MRVLCVTAVLAATLGAGPAPAAAGNRPAVSGRAAGPPGPWGVALVVNSSSTTTVQRQRGTWPSEYRVESSFGEPGEVLVRFPRIGLASGGVAHVTAVSNSPDWCQVRGWRQSGPDEIVAVRCHRHGAGQVLVPFYVVFGHSAQLVPAHQAAYAYVHWDGSAVAGRFNSSAATAVNSVARSATSPGVWQVVLPGLGTTGLAGNIQVTAVDAAVPARCKVGGWTPAAAEQKIVVRCFDAADVPLDTGWSLTYHRAQAVVATYPLLRSAYTFDNAPTTAGPYVPSPQAVNHNSTGGGLQLSRPQAGRKQVVLGEVGGYTDNVQVTAAGPGPAFCNLTRAAEFPTPSPAHAYIRYVACYQGTIPVDQHSMITYFVPYN
ncbi:hypothetical protein ACLQ2R_16230 [Streptosporangium sp. DT93]|uniref:hypothetical protein n=1 Tax=Streptosporangium sp. DT93 TaxID=3393428 RepID=UPI003CF74F35